MHKGSSDLYPEDQSGTEAVSELYPLHKIRTSAAPMPAQAPPLVRPSASVPLPLGPDNTITTCFYCNSLIKTSIRYTCTARTHIAAALWCTLCCMCCIPYMSNSAKNTDHYCPGCNRYLGTYQR